MERRVVKQAVAVLAVAAIGVAGSAGLARSDGTGTHGLSRTEDSNVEVRDAIHINERAGSQVIVSHITVQPGGHSVWHYHPGPHIVSVKTGTVRVYETDCTFKEYDRGDGFFDPGSTHHRHIHALKNPSTDVPAEIVITDVRTGDLRPAIAADPQPAPCP